MHPSTGEFVEKWLAGIKKKYPESKTVKTVSDATKDGSLDEKKLLKRFRELAIGNGEDSDDES
jgi:hypothetical protein